MDDYRTAGQFLTDCPARLTVDLIADKWTVVVLAGLSGRAVRRSELLRSIEGISGKVLTQTLHRLDAHGLIERHAYPDAPTRVEYRLSELGRTLIEPIQVLSEWSRLHGRDVLAALDRSTPQV